MREAWRPTVPSAESNLPEEPGLIIDPALNNMVIMKAGRIFKNTVS